MGKTETKTTTSTEELTEYQVAVRALVEKVEEPRTKDELADRYDGLRTENMWPEQSPAQVKSRIGELLEKGVLKEGDETPSGDPVIVLAD